MKTRIILALLMVALLVPASGCPRTPNVSPGVWLFILSGGVTYGVDLGADGTAQAPDPVPSVAVAVFDDPQSWTQDGSTFVFTAQTPGGGIMFTGTVDSSTRIIDGTFDAVGSVGTWFGIKL